MAYKDAIQEAYASAPIEEITVDTIELYHPAFVDDLGQPSAIRVCLSYENLTLGLEADAILNPGQAVQFLACEFTITLPEVSEDGATPTIQLGIANVSREITKYLELAKQSLIPIKVTYRPYLLSNPSLPQMDPPIVLEMSEIDVDVFQATGNATLEDIHNFPFPYETYNINRFPGLRR
jgi:hypothetical protein